MSAPSQSSEKSLQSFIHAIEQGRLAGVVRGFLFVVVVIALALAYLGWNFHGFVAPEAMDQAQVAREIARGNGWSTKFIRPAAIWQIEQNTGAVPRGNVPDTYNAPLSPAVNALAVKLAGVNWADDKARYKQQEFFAPAERYIVVLSMLFFIGAVAINFFTMSRLFDRRLALWSAVLTLLSDLCWQYTLSGLPQMLMLLLFSAAIYTLVRAMQSHLLVGAPVIVAEGASPEAAGEVDARGSAGRVLGWLALTGGFFGLLALSHALTVWLFAGVLVFAFIYFRRRGPVALVMLVVFGLCYAPWLVRTYHVSGNPFGLAGYTVFDGIASNTATRLRSAAGISIEGVEPHFFRVKLEHGMANQLDRLAQNLGGSLVALAFFFGLLHSFRRPEAAALRWGVLLMWLFGTFGMAFLGSDLEPTVSASQLGVLFLPVMIGYGLAFILVLFTRLEYSSGPLVRLGFFAVILLMSAASMLVTLLPEHKSPHQYPPYFEPSIHLLNGWTAENEITATDMPWAVAWCADRKALWIPNKLKEVLSLSDTGKFGDDRLAGIFLTTVSRDTSFINSIYKGQYQEYSQLIFGNPNLPYFPFREVVLPVGDLNYTFFSDTRRWDKKAAAQ